MLNVLWTALLAVGVAYGLAAGRADILSREAMAAAERALETLFGLAGVLAFWLGLAGVMEKAGLVRTAARIVTRLLRPLFPSVPPGHPALTSIAMNVSANTLGLGQAATPFGLRAMQQLQELNGGRPTASDAMVTFLVLNTAGVTVLPAAVIGVRALHGAADPAAIVVPGILTGLLGTVAGLAAERWLRRPAA